MFCPVNLSPLFILVGAILLEFRLQLGGKQNIRPACFGLQTDTGILNNQLRDPMMMGGFGKTDVSAREIPFQRGILNASSSLEHLQQHLHIWLGFVKTENIQIRPKKGAPTAFV